jgi:hypothetical protein
MRLSLFAAAAALLLASAIASVVINEVEQNPAGDESAFKSTVLAWFELYNDDDEDIDIGGWTINNSEGGSMTLPEGAIIKGLDYYISTVRPGWLAHKEEVLSLKNKAGAEVDRTPVLSDEEDDEAAWTRDPDGRDTNTLADWKFLASSSGF